MPKYALEIIVFIAGYIVLTFEVAGARIVGPYYGTSTFVWSSIIGVILASLSLGYSLGGRLADKHASKEILSSLLFASAIALSVTVAIKDILLSSLSLGVTDIRIGSIIASVVLFAPTSILLGMVSPYAVRLGLTRLESSGRRIGNLSALSTAGSILGTFATGFWLLPYMGVQSLLFTLPFGLLALSILSAPRFGTLFKILFAGFLVIVFRGISIAHAEPGVIAEADTLYSHIRIIDRTHRVTGERVRTLAINAENHSSMSLDSDRLVNEYTRYYHLVRHFVPDFSRGLMLGGAGYSFPKDYLKKYPNASLDVVEIDPGVTALAKQYFGLEDNPRLQIVHEDARVFLNQNTKKYDVIFGDAFSSWYSVPYQLTTREAVQRHYDSLTESGAVILNIISAIDGETGEFLRAEYHTYREIFPEVYIFPVSSPNPTQIQNITLVALKGTSPNWSTDDREIAEFLGHRYMGSIANDMPILTDDFAPVDHYISKFLGKM